MVADKCPSCGKQVTLHITVKDGNVIFADCYYACSTCGHIIEGPVNDKEIKHFIEGTTNETVE